MKVAIPILLFLIVGNVQAQGNRNFLNVGFKFSHCFGPGGGFSPGVEASYTMLGERFGGGILASIDACNGRTKIHFGVEGVGIVGISVGPTWISEGGKTAIGYTATIFSGLFFYPYYSYTSASDMPAYQELGSFVKFPIQVAGRKFSIGG